MNRSVRCLMLSVLTLAAFAGCEDQEAVKLRTAQQEYRAAMDAVRAVLDFAPAHKAAGEADTYEQWRQHADLEVSQRAQLDEAAKKLESVLQQRGQILAAEEVSAAQLVLADIYAGVGRAQARQALTAWSDLSNESNRLLAVVDAIDRGALRARQFGDLKSKLPADLEAFARQVEGESSKIQGELQTLQTAATALESERQEIVRVRNQKRQQASEARTRAASLKGEERYKLLESAVILDREASGKASEDEKKSLEAEVLREQIAVARAQLAANDRTVKIAREAASASHARNADVEASAAAALGEAANSAKTLDDAFEAIVQSGVSSVEGKTVSYSNHVDQALDRAVAPLARAVGAAEAAVGKAAGLGKNRAELALVGHQMTLLHVRTQQAEAASGLGSLLSAFISRAEAQQIPVTKYAAYYTELRKKQAELITQAKADLVKARDTARELAGKLGDSPDASTAKQQTESLDQYEQRLTAAALPEKLRKLKLASSVPLELPPAGAVPPAAEPEMKKPAPAPSKPEGEEPKPAPAAAAAGEIKAMPALPDAVFRQPVHILVSVRASHLTPEILRASVAKIVPGMAPQLEPMLAQYAESFGKITKDGLHGLVVAGTMSPDPAVHPDRRTYIFAPQVSAEGVKAVIDAIAPFPGTVTKLDDLWVALTDAGKAEPTGGDASQRAVVEEALSAAGEAGIAFSIIFTDAVRQSIKASAEKQGPEVAAKLQERAAQLEKSRWVTFAINLSGGLDIDALMAFSDAETASAMAAGLVAELDKAMQPAPGEQPDPAKLMMFGMLKGALKIEAKDQQVHVHLAGDKLSPLITMAAPMLQGMMGGGRGGPGLEIGPGDGSGAVPGNPDPNK